MHVCVCAREGETGTGMPPAWSARPRPQEVMHSDATHKRRGRAGPDHPSFIRVVTWGPGSLCFSACACTQHTPDHVRLSPPHQQTVLRVLEPRALMLWAQVVWRTTLQG